MKDLHATPDPGFFEDAWRRFDPFVPIPPADPEQWYEDLSGARGDLGDNDQTLVQRIARRIRRTADRPQRLLMLGHPGCGKSTELNRVSHILEREGFVCVRVDVDRDLDKEDLELPEIQVLIVERVGAVLEAHRIHLDDDLFARLRSWFVEEVETHATTAGGGAGAAVSTEGATRALFADLIPSITANVKVSSERRVELRTRVRKRLRDFVDMVCELLQAANEGIRRASKRGLVLLVDGLEKAGLDTAARGRASRILVDQAEQWALLPVATVITAPLSLLQERVRIANLYDEPYLVPAIPVSPRPGSGATDPAYVAEGRRVLRGLVQRRSPVSYLFEAEADFDFLMGRSGGNLRDLFRLIRAALDDSPEGRPITRRAVESASKRTAIQVRAALQAQDRELLQGLLKDPESLHYDADGVSLLQRELVLPYVNGGSWFGVHPALLDALKTR